MSDTPLMVQYREIKAQHADAILFFRMGDFYEMFYDDAHTAARVLNITLTSRGDGTPLAGVPVKAAAGYLRQFIARGFRVAICEQVEDPKLANFAGRVSDSGEGRWTIKAAIDEAVPAPVLSSALYSRFSSRGEADFADKLMSAMRFEFGGHLEKKA